MPAVPARAPAPAPRGDAPPARVVLTGLGVVSSIGVGVEEYTAGLRSGRSGAGPITSFDTHGFAHASGCAVVGFDPGRWIGSPLDLLGPTSRFAVSAARMAVRDSGLDAAALRDRPGMVAIGTTNGESQDLDRLVVELLTEGGPVIDPRVARRLRGSRLSVAVAAELGLSDVEAVTLPTACGAGNYAVGYGYDAVRAGDVDFALCGGADTMCRQTFAAFYRLGIIAPDCCRPFDAGRQGTLVGEGAGVLVLERLESALARGARIYAEVLGHGLTCDAVHRVAPDQSSVARAMALALADAGVTPDEVDLISAHGTGTRANDVTEARAIRQVYGDRPPRTVAVKSMLGHAMGAASALATIACALAITHRFIPPTINHRSTDPECRIDCVPNEAVDADLRIVQNNGFGFGGNNAVTILGRYEGRR